MGEAEEELRAFKADAQTAKKAKNTKKLIREVADIQAKKEITDIKQSLGLVSSDCEVLHKVFDDFSATQNRELLKIRSSIPSQADILQQIMDVINPVKKDVADLQKEMLLPTDVRKEVESALENVKANIKDLYVTVDSLRLLITPRTMERINNDFTHLFDQYERIELLLMTADAKKGEGLMDKEADQSSASHHLPETEVLVITNPDPLPRSVRVPKVSQRQTTASAAADQPIEVAAIAPPPPPKLTPAQALKQLQQKQSSSTSVSLKRPRTEEKEKTKEKRQNIVPINASDLAFNASLSGSQRLSTYPTMQILKSHAQGVQFPKTDFWVPDDLNQWWEELKEIYLK